MGQFTHLYKTAYWQSLRRQQLLCEPLCRFCKQLGQLVRATVVDHVIAHKGDEELFSDPENLQSLCKPCHDGHKQRQEKSGYLAGGDANGFPLDPNHHWNN